ncbi:MAG TPA: GTP 3',8-cyclase MoaA [Candidatus Deferrimicrobium sp.]|nr:GTP 3',8-cyclase MoaA [Candidatus Deferrimicrobium sp.]
MCLTDSFGRRHTYLRVSLTDRCNLRCRYCMPAEGISWRSRADILTLEEILHVARVLVSQGVTKVRLTGGEPLVRQNIEWLIRRLAATPDLETVAMTTNGMLLKNKVRSLREAGLTALNVSLDTLRPERFRQIAGRDRFADVITGIEEALAAGFRPLKVNTVIMAGVNDDELLDFVALAKNRPINVRFIEYMPSRGTSWDRSAVFSCHEMMRRIETLHRLTPAENTYARMSSVARDFVIAAHAGKVSFISPLSADFCDRCSRIRLTADGFIKPCLFQSGTINLRDALRRGATDDQLGALIRAALDVKHDRHQPVTTLAADRERTMCEIGG